MSSINGHPVIPYSSGALMVGGIRLMFPRPVKPSANMTVKGLNIAQIKRNPDHPSDKGMLHNLVVQSCEFERMVLFENQSKLSVLFKCKNGDAESDKFVDFMKKLDDRMIGLVSGDGINYPKELGHVNMRYKPIVKEDQYNGVTKMEIRAEIPLYDGKAKDTMFFEMMEDQAAAISCTEFMEKYKHRPVVAIIEFPYMTVMNSGTKSIAVKPVIKQLLIMPQAKMDEGVQDNNCFKFIGF